MKINFDHKFWHWIIIFLLALTWGSSFILMKRGLEVFTDPQVAALRMFVAFLCLLPFALKHLSSLKGKYWKPLLVVGLIGNGIPSFFFTLISPGLVICCLILDLLTKTSSSPPSRFLLRIFSFYFYLPTFLQS